MANSQQLASVLVSLASSENPEQKIESFFRYVQENNFSGLLPQVKEHVVRMQQNKDDYNTLTVESAYELSSKELNNIKEIVGAPNEVTINQVISEDLLGSFRKILLELSS
jgi:F0F1-type ATP synthase delta subunit